MRRIQHGSELWRIMFWLLALSLVASGAPAQRPATGADAGTTTATAPTVPGGKVTLKPIIRTPQKVRLAPVIQKQNGAAGVTTSSAVALKPIKIGEKPAETPVPLAAPAAATPRPRRPLATPVATATPVAQPAAVETPTVSPETPAAQPTPVASPEATPEPTPLVTPEPTPEALPQATPAPEMPVTPVVTPVPQAIPDSVPAEPPAAADGIHQENWQPTQEAPPILEPLTTDAAAGSGDGAGESQSVAAQFDAALKAEPSVATRAQLRQLVIDNTQNPNVPLALLKIGEISLHVNDAKEAKMAYQAALRLGRDLNQRRQAQAGLAQALTRAGAYQDAVAQWEALRKGHADLAKNPKIMAAEAWNRAAAGDYTGADQLWKDVQSELEAKGAQDGAPGQARAAAPAAATVMAGQALTAELQGRVEEARAIWSKINEGHADRPEAALARARLEDLAKGLEQ